MIATSNGPQGGGDGGGALYLVMAQVASRGFTFLGNQFLLRYLSPSLLGLAVQLELLSITILYFARESLRVALQRQPLRGETTTKTNELTFQPLVNLAYLVIAVGLGTCVGLGQGYLKGASNEVLSSIDFWLAFKLYAIATFTELFAEPCFVIIQQHALYKARARAETAAAIARCVLACSVAIIMHRRHIPVSVLPFAIGQTAYGAVLFISYLFAVTPLQSLEHFSLLPRIIKSGEDDDRSSLYFLGLFPKPTLLLTTTFYAQSVFKLLLSQGDSIILSVLTDLKSQGAFALASNYGGLLSRLVFQPVEESSRNVFGRLLASPSSLSSSSSTDPDVTTDDSKSKQKDDIYSDPTTIINAKPTKFSNQALSHISISLSQALTHLSTTLHIYTLFTLPLLSIITPILPPLLTIILPSQWRTNETTALFQAYIHYIPFIAINGVLDAFVTSVATPAQLRTQSLIMAGVTVIYGLVAWTLLGSSESVTGLRRAMLGGDGSSMGSVGLVWANIVNMFLRVGYSIWFIFVYLSARTGADGGGQTELRRLWRRSLPATSCIFVAGLVGAVLRRGLHSSADTLSTKSFLGFKGLNSEDVGYVASGAVVLGSSILISEHQFLLDLIMPLVPERLAEKMKPYLPNAGRKQE